MRLRSLVAALLPLAACDDALGRPLVDTFQSGSPENETCDYLSTCEIETFPVQPDVQLLDERALVCSQACTSEPCVAPKSSRLVDSQKLSCKALSLDLGNTASELREISLENSVLTIHAETPTSLTISASSIRNSSLELSGPITLVLVGETSLVRSRILAAQYPEGRPQVQFQDSNMDAVHVGSEDLDFAVVRSLISRSRLKVRNMRIESSSVIDTELASNMFEAVDVNLERSLIDGDGYVSASTIIKSEIGRCDYLLIAGSDIKQTQITGCRQLLRLYNDNVDGGYLDGPIEADSTGVSRASLGVRAATQLLGFNVVVADSAVCERTDQLRLAGGSMRCVACAGPLEEGEPLACQAPNTKVLLQKMLCSGLASVSECTEHFPARHRQPGSP